LTSPNSRRNAVAKFAALEQPAGSWRLECSIAHGEEERSNRK